MNFLKSLLKLLNKPFPEQESSFGEIRIVIIVSVFVTFFLYVFEPFGLALLESNKFLVCLGFGMMTFIAAIIFEFVVGRLLHLKGKLENWTLGKWVLYNLGVMLTISLANFLFARILFFGFIEWGLLPDMMYGTFMIGIIPIAVIGGLSLLIQEKKYQGIAADINQHQTVHANKIEDQRLLFDIPFSRIQYVEALQNYVYIGYVDAEGQFKKLTERAALKNILEEVKDSTIIKSHRSFLVNREAIISISGNAQGLLLQLSKSDRTIPVSRSYVASFRGN